MRPRHPSSSIHIPLPHIWLMTDARNDDSLCRAIANLPQNSGVIFRHYHLEHSARRKRFDEIRLLARRYGHRIILADSARRAHKWRADGFHGRRVSIKCRGKLIYTAPVHNIKEARAAKQSGANMIFVSPIFPTRSHPGARSMTRTMLQRIIAHNNVPVILLGGMDVRRFIRLKPLGAYGWAAIDGLSTV